MLAGSHRGSGFEDFVIYMRFIVPCLDCCGGKVVEVADDCLSRQCVSAEDAALVMIWWWDP